MPADELRHELQRLPRVEDVVDHQHVPAADVEREAGDELGRADRGGAGAVAGDADAVEADRVVDLAHQVAGEHHRAVDEGDEREFLLAVDRLDLGGERADPPPDLGSREEDAGEGAGDGRLRHSGAGEPDRRHPGGQPVPARVSALDRPGRRDTVLASLPDGVTAAQATLTRLVMVRIHVGQPFDAALSGLAHGRPRARRGEWPELVEWGLLKLGFRYDGGRSGSCGHLWA